MIRERRTTARETVRLATILLAGSAAWSCGGGGGDGFVNPPAVIVTISPQTATVNVGGSTTLVVSISGGAPTPSLAGCTSQSPGVATASVDGSSCRVVGVSAGTSTITASATGGQSATAQVTVAALPPAITALSLTPPTASISVGQTTTLTAVPTNPAGATVNIAFQSGNTSVATVANNGVVTAVSAGTAVITATATATGPNLAPTTIAQTSTITVTANACAPVTVTLPSARNGSVTASSCIVSTDIQRRGDVLRVNLAAATAVELRMVPVGFSAYLTAFPANEAEFIYFTGNASQELRRVWHLPSGVTEFRIGSAIAGQTGTYSFAATAVSPNVTGCSAVVTGGSLETTQSLASGDCVSSGRLADEFLLFSSRPCVITMAKATSGSMANPFLEVYAGSQLFAQDNDGGGNGNARIALSACRSPAGDVLSVRATSFGAGDSGNYVFTVLFGP